MKDILTSLLSSDEIPLQSIELSSLPSGFSLTDARASLSDGNSHERERERERRESKYVSGRKEKERNKCSRREKMMRDDEQE